MRPMWYGSDLSAAKHGTGTLFCKKVSYIKLSLLNYLGFCHRSMCDKKLCV